MTFTHINSKGETYYLHHRSQMLKGGRMQDLYFFGKSISTKGTPLEEIPEGYIVVENPKTGLVCLKKDK